MGYEPRIYTDEEIIADFELKAAHWEREAARDPAVAAVCIDYATHLRTLAECFRLDMLDRRA